MLAQEKEKNKKLKDSQKNNNIDIEKLKTLLNEEKEKNKILNANQEQNYVEIEKLKIKLKEEKEKNEKELKEYKNKNDINIEQLKLKTSQLDTFAKTLDEKDELIKKLRNNYMQNKEDKIKQFQKEIMELEEKNKNLLKENDELKQSNIILIKSSNTDLLKISQSKNQINDRFSDIYDSVEKKETTELHNYNEIINELKIENENLKKQNEELKLKNKEIKEEKEIKRKNILSQSANSAGSDEEEEFDVNYLANTAKRKNNSEDMKIDYPGLNNINEKYEELKNKIIEIKETFNYIISKIQVNEPDIKPKIDRVHELLNIDSDE